MSPAETLRAAATLIRETADDASSDLWDALFPDSRAPHIKAMNAWVRLMSPDKAEPLAAWLEWAARQADMNEHLAPRHRIDLTEALAFARSILGRTS